MSTQQKAKLRGVSHNFAAVAAAAAGIMLTLDSPPRARLGCAIYTMCLTFMFSMSALYHRPTWPPKSRAFMRRLDHCGIYALISGTYTPLCILSLDQDTGNHILKLVWGGALAGIAFTLLSKGGIGSKVLSAALYVALGWTILPYADQLKAALGPTATWLVVAGGVIYSIGAIIYALKWPDPFPSTYGYHEVFHAFVILAALLHFIAVRMIVKSSSHHTN